MTNTYLIGREAEDIAAGYLTKNKLKIICRNYRTRFGEVDIIAKEKKELVFVEVKAKSTSVFGKPYEMVTEKKKAKIIKIAKSYLVENGTDPEDIQWRIDVVSIDYKNNEVEWLKNAVLDE